MEYRELGDTGIMVSAVSFGTWAIGGSWGSVKEQTALEGLARAIDAGVTFFDTADVYGNGRAERLLAQATKGREYDVYIATKFCRKGDIQDPSNYSLSSVRAYCEASLKHLSRDTIDLYQIHCPPAKILEQGDVFHVLDQLKQEGKIREYGVSVETVAEAITAMQYPGVKALQVIFNLFRQKPVDELFPIAAQKKVGILVRLPLASGLLTGKFKIGDVFPADDHRNFNRDGQSFNVGETFAGLPFDKGVDLAQQLTWITEGRENMARASMRWILDHKEVTCVIPGFKNATQVNDNLGALDAPHFTVEEMQRTKEFYQERVASFIRGAY